MKVGDKVKIIDTSFIEPCELGKIGTIIEVDVYDCSYKPTMRVDMGRVRRKWRPEDKSTCWWLLEKHLELVSRIGMQLHFEFKD